MYKWPFARCKTLKQRTWDIDYLSARCQCFGLQNKTCIDLAGWWFSIYIYRVYIYIYRVYIYTVYIYNIYIYTYIYIIYILYIYLYYIYVCMRQYIFLVATIEMFPWSSYENQKKLRLNERHNDDMVTSDFYMSGSFVEVYILDCVRSSPVYTLACMDGLTFSALTWCYLHPFHRESLVMYVFWLYPMSFIFEFHRVRLFQWSLPHICLTCWSYHFMVGVACGP
jgi:hypothetical protein